MRPGYVCCLPGTTGSWSNRDGSVRRVRRGRLDSGRRSRPRRKCSIVGRVNDPAHSTTPNDWLRNEAAIAARLIVLAAAGLLVIWLALRVQNITIAVFLAFTQAALLWPVVQKLSRVMPRPLASLLVVGVYAAAILSLIWFIIVQMVNAWPTILSAVLGSVEATNDWFLERGWALPPTLVENLQGQVQDRAAQLFSGIGGAALSGLGLIGSGATILLVTAFATLFALIGGVKMTQGILDMVPAHRRRSAYAALRDGATTARWWMFASTVTGLVDGVLIGFGMYLLDVPLAVPIGLATFILGYIPMIGATVAGILAVAVALFFGGVNTAVATTVLVLAVQQIEGNVLSPLLLSRAMQFPPLLTLLLSMVGGTALGIAGLFLAVPVAGIITAAVKAWRRELREQQHPDPNEPAEPAPDPPDDLEPDAVPAEKGEVRGAG